MIRMFDSFSGVKTFQIGKSPAPTFYSSSSLFPYEDLFYEKNKRIIGGSETSTVAYNMVAQLEFSNKTLDSPYVCGGTAINNHWILTAAHCCEYQNIVFVDFVQDHVSTAKIPITERNMYIHNLYSIDERYDLCLLFVEDNIQDLWPDVQFPCINDSNDIQHGESCTVVGWGKLQENGPLSVTLQEASVHRLSNDYCSQFSFGENYLSEADICAANGLDENDDGLLDAGIDSCQGDSGGPLFCQIDGYLSLVGVVSRGEGCARVGFPGLYTSIYAGLEFISNLMV
jgi:secreted trypsin-like serine protease